ncbi:chemotaxis protein CheY [Tenacibaculum holothuriorum]|uniref:Chemotaxis protein CheY n=1 Tax=Tenacibaculum holothuriorum TaxID=1635173 RepID=A0A1Y2P9C5_9FLAO|nr:LytTR family DNA-binding domain-containing protein [Tenacibaculum holothuriorum]OSY87042.1 chemotaxis protein CheY [Tenacibaculum holothuriorum]
MSHKCLIIDDEKLARELLEAYVSQVPNFELVASCASAIEASEILNNNQIDLLFLDIEMPVLKGTDFFKNLVQKPKVIFTTAYRNYAIDGFELNAVDYLLKPIVFDRFFKAIQKFLATQKASEKERDVTSEKELKNDFLFISKGRKQIKILFKEVLYIESLKDYIKIHLERETHTIKYKISVFETELDNRFTRVHRSYIVNTNKVTAYTKDDVEIGKIEIPIGGNYKNIILSKLQSLHK